MKENFKKWISKFKVSYEKSFSKRESPKINLKKRISKSEFQKIEFGKVNLGKWILKSEFGKLNFVMNFLSDFDSEFFYEFISYFLSSQLILVIYSLFIHLKTLNTIWRHVPNVLVFEASLSFVGTWKLPEKTILQCCRGLILIELKEQTLHETRSLIPWLIIN